MIKLPDRLIRATKSGRLVPFVGAGISKKAMHGLFPSWSELMYEMVDLAQKEGGITSGEQRELIRLLKDGKLTVVADVVKRVLQEETFDRYLDRRFNYSDLSKANLDTQVLLLKISSRLIVTTNYDHLLEDAFARHFRRSPMVATFREAYSVQNATQDYNADTYPLIFKVHGDVRVKDSLILSDRDYRSLLYDHQTYGSVITSIFMNSTMLFVGFSLSDREIMSHLERVRHRLNYVSQSHFALVPKGSVTITELRFFKEAFGVESIEFDAANGYDEIDRILGKLVRERGKAT